MNPRIERKKKDNYLYKTANLADPDQNRMSQTYNDKTRISELFVRQNKLQHDILSISSSFKDEMA